MLRRFSLPSSQLSSLLCVMVQVELAIKALGEKARKVRCPSTWLLIVWLPTLLAWLPAIAIALPCSAMPHPSCCSLRSLQCLTYFSDLQPTQNQLAIEDMVGGTFTISNGGTRTTPYQSCSSTLRNHSCYCISRLACFNACCLHLRCFEIVL
jgi:hypothetical protein